MSDWIDVASTDQFSPGSHKVVDVDGVEVAVFNIGGEFLAIEDICTHDGGELACGELEGDVIVCPRHGAKFSLRTGAVLAPPAYEPVATLPIRVENNVVQVKDDRWD
ncbi:non-heme iron oxygenase ferredoxin subunit [Gammaproteobacteria bacterium]|nr:non-heme iron oxygenase ferredoxin subunit [Gammaproteobacteria bacterium]